MKKSQKTMMQKLQLLVCFILLLTIGSNPLSAQKQSTEPVKGILRIKLQEELPESAVKTRSGISQTGIHPIDAVNNKLKVTKMKRMFPYSPKHEEDMRQFGLHLWYEIEYDNNITPAEAARMYRGTAGIQSADMVRPMVLMDGSRNIGEDVSAPATRSTLAPFNDPLVKRQWHYQNDGSIEGSVAGSDINLFKAWEITAGSKDVIVAIIDGGIDYKHEDLTENIWINEAELNGTEGLDDDGNGYIDDVYGWNFIRQSNMIYPHDHGTHVAGTVGAVNNNGIGVCGVAGGSGNHDGIKMMSCQIFDVIEGTGTTEYAKSIVYAANNGAVIAQCSWGWNEPEYEEESVKDAIDYFTEKAGNYESSPMKGGLCIFATGNLGRPGKFYPAAYENVVAVGAMGADLKVATYTNYGSYLDITAPGGDGDFDQRLAVYSTKPRNTYGYMDGTSMATPHVSGVAALVVSKFGSKDFTNEDLRKHLLTAVKDLYVNNPEWTGLFGRGYLDAEMALQNDGKKAPAQITDFSLEPSQQEISVEWTIPNDEDDHRVERHIIYWSTKPFTATTDLSTLNAHEIDTKFRETGSTISEELGGLTSETEYWLAIQSIDRWGNASVLSPVKSAHTNAGPQVELSDEFLFLNVDVNNSYIETTQLTATNTGEGLLKWKAQIRQKSEDYMGTLMMSVTYPKRSAIASSYPGLLRMQSRAADEIVKADFMKEDFPQYMEYYKTYIYDIGETDTSRTNSMAQYFKVDPEIYPKGFNLTHFTAQTIKPQGKVILEVYGDAPSITEAPLLLSDTLLSIDYENPVPYSSQLYFEAGEGFWMVVHISSGNDAAFGIGEESSPEYSDYCYYSSDKGKNWAPLKEVLKDNFKDIAETSVFTAKAISKYPHFKDYITVTPSEGKTSTGESALIKLQTSRMDIPDGYYNYNLWFESNETGHTHRNIPLSLQVSGHKPAISSARVVNFGDVFVGKKKTIQVELINTGYGNLVGEYGMPYSATSSDPQFTLPEMFDLPQFPARSKIYLPVTYTPATKGSVTATITLQGDGYQHQFLVRGIADVPAKIEVSPTTINAGDLVYQANPVTKNITITNSGNYPLEYVFPLFSDDTLSGLTTTSHKFGYFYSSNLTDPSEAIYQWTDLAVPTNIASHFNDDVLLSDAIEIGFEFPYYGKTYDKIYISKYGALSVTGEGFDLMMCHEMLSSDPLCTGGMGLISALGLPLQFNPDSKVLYGKQNGQFIVSYENAILQTMSASLLPVSFQIILSENGNIDINFKEYDVTRFDNKGELNEFTGGNVIFIGFTDPGSTDPLVITDYDLVENSGFTNKLYKKFGNEKTIHIQAPGSNMIRDIDFPSGIVQAGENKTVTLTLAADTTMYTGPLKNVLTLLNSDPLQSTVYLTLNANIKGDYYKPLLTLNTKELDFGNLFQSAVVKEAISIKNIGHAPIDITNVSMQNSSMDISFPQCPYTLNPGNSVDVVIQAPTANKGNAEDILEITADNGNVITATVRARIIGAPAITLNPDVINTTIAAGTSRSMTQEITNTGDEALVYSFQPSSYYYPINTLATESEEIDYAFSSSANDKNVVYEWEDIRETGEHVRADYYITRDYVKVPLPDKITFYGQQFDTMYIYGTGFLTFQYYTDGNHPMPDPPVNMPDVSNTFINCIAPFWGMHSPAETGTSGVYYELKEDRVIVSFLEYGSIMNAGVNFQAIIYHNGRIKFQYNISEEGHLTSLFGIGGLENGDHTKGIKLPNRFIGDKKAVILYPVKTITLQPGESRNEAMLLDAVDLLAGSYNEDVLLSTNVPGEENKVLPLSMNVTGSANPIFPEIIDFGDVLVNFVPETNLYNVDFEIRNNGKAAFHINDYDLKHNDDYLLNVSFINNNSGGDIPGPGPLGMHYGDPIVVGKEPVKFNAVINGMIAEAGKRLDTLMIMTDLPGKGIVNIPLRINAVNPPVMDIPQGNIEWYAPVDTLRFDSVFTISNESGQYKLDYTVSIIHSSSAVSSTSQTAYQQGATSREDDIFPGHSEYTRELRYEILGRPSDYLGTGDEYTAFEALTAYEAPAEGFNIAAVECLATIVGVETGDIIAEIRVGNPLSPASTITKGKLHITDNRQDYRLIKLDRPVYINAGETFYVYLKFPVGAKFPLAFITVTDKDKDGRYQAKFDEQWKDLLDFSGQYGTIGFVMRCLEKEAGTPWISIEDPNNGEIAQGSKGNLIIHANAKTARYMKGNRATIRINSIIDPKNINKTFMVTLDKNEAPEITAPTTTIDISENETLELLYKVVDKEADAFSVHIEDQNSITSHNLAENDLTVTLHPQFGQAGSQSFIIVATDEYGNASRHEVNYYVKKKNRAPVVLQQPESFKANLGEIIEALDLTQIFNDPDGDTLRYTIRSSDPAIALAFAKDDYLEFTQKEKGETEFTVTATDPEGLSATVSFDLELLGTRNLKADSKITVYPNPVLYLMTISCPPAIEGESVIRLYNIGGMLVYTEKTTLGPEISKTLDMSVFPAGVYVLEIECKGDKMSTKVVKQ